MRSIFISDVHLGCKYTHADSLLVFLKNHQPDYLYIVGDFLDGWRLTKKWYWDDTYTFLFKHIVDLMKRGTRVFYTPGNHDEFLRDFIENLGSVQLADEFIHTTADNRKLLVTHGDNFDTCVRHVKWLSHLGDSGYNFLLGVNKVFNAIRRKLGFGYWSLSRAIKQKVKQGTSYIDGFEDIVTRHAKEQGCVGAVCGHTHTPKILEKEDGFTYYNTGDWVESCTALVEYANGKMELLYRPLNVPAHELAQALASDLDESPVTKSRQRLPEIPILNPAFVADGSALVDAPNAG
jgi:UDP-2,3-diacylglucosamine pyrophosphatase LpxH